MLLQYENEHNPEKDYEYPKVSLPKWMRERVIIKEEDKIKVNLGLDNLIALKQKVK